MLIDSDILLWRSRYDEALELRGIPAKYQYPILPDVSVQGEVVIDTYSDLVDTQIFFESTPKIKTLRRYGWVIDNSDELPIIVHCSWNLPNVQKDSIFRFSGIYSEVEDKIFRVTEISYIVECPDHIICQVVPIYEDQLVGRTEVEISKTFTTSNHFLRPHSDYRGNPIVTKEQGVVRKRDAGKEV